MDRFFLLIIVCILLFSGAARAQFHMTLSPQAGIQIDRTSGQDPEIWGFFAPLIIPEYDFKAFSHSKGNVYLSTEADLFHDAQADVFLEAGGSLKQERGAGEWVEGISAGYVNQERVDTIVEPLKYSSFSGKVQYKRKFTHTFKLKYALDIVNVVDSLDRIDFKNSVKSSITLKISPWIYPGFDLALARNISTGEALPLRIAPNDTITMDYTYTSVGLSAFFISLIMEKYFLSGLFNFCLRYYDEGPVSSREAPGQLKKRENAKTSLFFLDLSLNRELGPSLELMFEYILYYNIPDFTKNYTSHRIGTGINWQF
jgi:hypothetical protein